MKMKMGIGMFMMSKENYKKSLLLTMMKYFYLVNLVPKIGMN
ncbi:hypothetical protein [Calidifontibacillus erzurumensis]